MTGKIRRASVATAVLALGLLLVPSVPAAAAEPIKIMPLGDSITEAYDVWEGNEETKPSYRSPLWDLLQTGGHTNVDFVGSRWGVFDSSDPPDGFVDPGGTFDKDHEGHVGWLADEILLGRQGSTQGDIALWASTHVPDIVLLHLGTNDVFNLQPSAETADELEQIIGVLRTYNPNVAVLVARVIPLTGQFAWLNPAIDALNTEIDLLASLDTPEARVIIVDHNTGFDPSWLPDDVHPDLDGQAFIAQQWFDAMLANGLLANVAPIATAGPDQTTTSLIVALAGSVQDDGLPDPPGAVTTTWSATGGGVPADPNALVTTVAFPAPGTHTITLTADDGELTHQDSLIVVINGPPVADAGPDQLSTGLTFTLNGSVTDDGIPNPPGATTTTWSVTGGGEIADPNVLSTTISFPDEGSYTVTLTADDGELTHQDTMLVVILFDPVVDGYWMLEFDGTVYPFGSALDLPDAFGQTSSAAHAVAMAATPSGDGYWILLSDGSVLAYGDATDLGSVSVGAGETAASISATPSGAGYWVFTDLGRVLAFGDAPFLGDVFHLTLEGPIVASIGTPDGAGYYMLGSDGGVFAFGTAAFYGSIPEVLPGVTLDGPIVGLVPTADNDGYWMVGNDGGVFAFGKAGFVGSIPEVLPGVTLNAPVNGMIAFGDGYLMVASDGGIFNFSSLPFFGSLGANPPDTDIVAVSASIA